VDDGTNEQLDDDDDDQSDNHLWGMLPDESLSDESLSRHIKYNN